MPSTRTVMLTAALLLAVPAVAPAAVMRGHRGADRLVGSPGKDRLYGMAGADRLDGRGDADRVFGGPGPDRITADSSDRVRAGRGNDRVTLVATPRRVRISCGAGWDRLTVMNGAGLTRRMVRRRSRGCEVIRLKPMAAAPAPIPPAAAAPGNPFGVAVGAPSPLAPPSVPDPPALPTPTPTPTATPTPTPSGPADLFVAPSGSDAGSCTAPAPCQSFTRAYTIAAAGDVVEVGAGVFGAQEVPEGTKAVVFRGVAGNEVRKLDNHASNVTFDGLDVDADGGTPAGAVFENHADPEGQNVTFRNGRIGNVVDEKGALLGGWGSTAALNVVIDNVEFHDVVQRTDGVHNECVYSQAPGLVIRNSRFTDCATMDLFIKRGDWWGQPPYGGVTLENNVFGHSVNGAGWHYYSLYWANDRFENVRVVNNTFESAVILDGIGSAPYSGVWANNVGGGWDCLSGVTFRNNLGKTCDASDIASSPQNSCAPPACSPAQTMPVGWVDPVHFDFHLKAGSPAINAASAAYAPAKDHDGKPRNGPPDAGAYEF